MNLMNHLILITIRIRESEETERRTNEDMEEKRREISELSSDLAAARWMYLDHFLFTFGLKFPHYHPAEFEGKLTGGCLCQIEIFKSRSVNKDKFYLPGFLSLIVIDLRLFRIMIISGKKSKSSWVE